MCEGDSNSLFGVVQVGNCIKKFPFSHLCSRRCFCHRKSNSVLDKRQVKTPVLASFCSLSAGARVLYYTIAKEGIVSGMLSPCNVYPDGFVDSALSYLQSLEPINDARPSVNADEVVNAMKEFCNLILLNPGTLSPVNLEGLDEGTKGLRITRMVLQVMDWIIRDMYLISLPKTSCTLVKRALVADHLLATLLLLASPISGPVSVLLPPMFRAPPQIRLRHGFAFCLPAFGGSGFAASPILLHPDLSKA